VPVVANSRGGVRTDSVVLSILPSAVHGELDHLVHEAGTLVRLKTVGSHEQSQLLSPSLTMGERQPFGDVVVVSLSVVPRNLR
jgi:hypothetical protein